MKEGYSKKYGIKTLIAETPLEAIEHLETFLLCDMWYALGCELETEEDMINYLRGHFEICKNRIKNINKENE